MVKKLLAICSFTLFAALSQAQNFPVAGATWIFEIAVPIWADDGGEKWEYIGDSVVANGVLKEMKVTRKTLNPGWPPSASDTVITNIWTEWFRYAGDTIWSVDDTVEYPICNFGLDVGDSSYTPFYNAVNLSWFGSGNECTDVDSAIVFQKGVVTEVGTEIIDGISSRYYRLAFTNEVGAPDTVRFSERSIITERYWQTYLLNICDAIIEAHWYHLTCFYDDSSTVVCPADYWFEHLELTAPEQLAVEIFPNPATEQITVAHPSDEALRAAVIDMQGRTIASEITLAPSSGTTIDLSGWKAGVYVLRLEANEQLLWKKFVKE